MSGEYEPWFTDWIRLTITEEMTFVDVGANCGHFTVVAGVAASIVAVEPHPERRARLQENVRYAGLTNVTVIKKPLFSKVVRGDILGSGRQLHIFPDGTVETTTLDALNLAPDIIKIDTEGAEYDILVGGIQTLLQYSPVLLIEVHPTQLQRYGHEEEDVYRFLRRLDYEIIELERYEHRLWIRAVKL